MTKSILRRTDFTLLAATLGIILMSLVIIGSATHINTPSDDRYWFVARQGIFALMNIGLAVFLMNFDYKMLQGYGNRLYVFNLIMLVAVMLVGQSALGAQRWISIGPISIQPSEFSKIIMIISLAAMLEERVGKLNTLHDLLPVAAYVGVPFLLVLKQPDLGTSLVFMAIFLGMIFISGINLRLLGGIFAEGIDLKNDRLIGVAVVGTGLPMVCDERELFRNYFDNKNDSGFEYAYLYNGMNKVMQAAGRVIRTMEDTGAILLLDERFLNRQYLELFPREWSDYRKVTYNSINKELEDFWKIH